ncbi:MAG: DUF4296 domain-containing protein [Bacteroidales bacterium]|nr:DUF4296 domain-containing protein [Bacteroidales bacterium]
MLRAARHIVLALCLLLALSACGPRRIPKGDMEDIFYLMFLQDQKIKQDRSLKQMADTSLVYEGILESKGYDTDDYLYSLHEYLAEPEKMEKIMGNVAERLEKELKVVRSEVELEKWRDKMLSIYRKQIDTSKFPKPRVRPVDTLKVRFDGDSAYMHKEIDSLKLIPRDSLIFLRDTLDVPADTLLEVTDSL